MYAHVLTITSLIKMPLAYPSSKSCQNYVSYRLFISKFKTVLFLNETRCYFH